MTETLTREQAMSEKPSFEAIAYGLLWRSVSDSSLVKTARHALRSSLSKDEQKAGIAWVVENHGPMTTADLIANDIRCGIFPERSYEKDPAPWRQAMSEKLTREQIEWCRKVLTALTEGAVMKPGDTFGLKQPEWSKRVYALCDMALAWLDVQPRPIEEAPKNGTRLLLSGPDKDGGKYTDCSAWPEGWTGKWPVEYMAYSAGPPTHFIPLSSLPEPK